MAWPQWPVGGTPTLPGVINPAPTVANPTQPILNATVPAQYTPEQWAQMQHQNWQQWAQWQQQYQQWHQQYGAEYQKALSAQNAATIQPPLPVQPVALPNTSLPPPPPVEPKPPLPPEDPPQQPPANFTQQPPPNKFERNYNTARNANWKPMTDNRNRRFSGSSQDQNFGKRNTNYSSGGGEAKRSRPDENWQKMSDISPNQWNSNNTPQKQQQPSKTMNAEELSEAEKKFDKQFAEWEAQFNKWKEQNANHPDKTQYREYEKKWETWRAQLLERREQMRRKRLNLANASPNAMKNEKKQPLLTTPDAGIDNFNRPPPTVNNDPLEFTKKSDFDDVGSSKSLETQEKNKFDASFLSGANAGGIPGLDLVKDEEKPDEDVINVDNIKPPIQENKAQDLDALSKGINSILGDQKLLSMLSMVSQNQNLNFNIKQTPLDKPEFSNQSMEETSNPIVGHSFNKTSEGFNTFDDQTRSSFTAGLNDQELKFEPPRPNDTANRMSFRGPSDFENLRSNEQKPSGLNFRNSGPPRGRNNIELQSDFGGGDFTRNEDNWEDYNRSSRHPNFDRSGRNNFNEFSRGDSNEFSRGAPNEFNRGGSIEFNRGPNEFNRGGPSEFNREEFARGGPKDFNRDGNDFDRGAPNEFNKSGPENFNRGGPNDFNRFGSNEFNRGSSNDFNRGGPNDFNRGLNEERNIFSKPDRWASGFNKHSRFEDNSFNDQDNLRSNPRDNFRGNGPNRFGDGGGGGDGIPGNMDGVSREDFRDHSNYIGSERNIENEDYRRRPASNFNQGPPRGNENFGGPDRFDRVGNRIHSENFANQQNEPWRGPVKNFNDNSFDSKKGGFSGPGCQFNFEPPDRSNQIDEHSMHSLQGVSEPEDILKPETIVEYDHKSLKPVEPEVIVEPIQTFDYRHKPVNRIPVPQRPQWLSETLRGVREFEPLLNMRSLEQTRRYNDWKYDDRKKYDPFYDERRRFDDYIEQPRVESRYNYEDRRSYDERRSYERSRSREHDDFNEDSRHGYRNYNNRHDERRKYDDDLAFDRSNRYEDKIRNDRYEERERKVENKVVVEDPKPTTAPVNMTTAKNSNVTLVEDLLSPPGRFSRPARIVIILRGPPGSGKTTLAKLIKDKEVENGGSAPRILSLDDYFMVEHEKEITEDGRKIKIKDMKYEYEECMEASYRTSLMKSFKKTVTDGFFNFIIVDNVNDKIKYFGEMWSFAKQNGFQVYVCQLELDVQACTKRNLHGRTEAEIEKCVAGWEPTPSHHPVVDVTSLIQAQSIPEVEMEEINSPPSMEEDGDEEHAYRSKWDTFDCSLDNLAKLDGTSKPLKPSRTMEDYLQLDDWEPKRESKPGQKRVRWADLEERKEQEKMRAIGFVVGQTNWDRMMDPTMGGSALTQTKYIERVGKY